MIQFLSKYKFFAAVMLVLSLIIITLIYQALRPEPKLPVYQPNMVNVELVDSTKQYVRKYHTIADFSLTNQNGETVTQKDYEGKIYVADFFFTTCPTICPIMTDNMVRLQEILKDNNHVKLLSHSVTPEIDSVPVLKAYALKKEVNDKKWNMVTGDRIQIYDLARKSYLVAQTDPDGDDYAMIHTENFVLVDTKRRIRGFYDGTNWEEMEQLLDDLSILMKEEMIQ
jgi:protein SCO1/2